MTYSFVKLNTLLFGASPFVSLVKLRRPLVTMGGLVAEWLACWIQAQWGLGSKRSRDAVGKLS